MTQGSRHRHSPRRHRRPANEDYIIHADYTRCLLGWSVTVRSAVGIAKVTTGGSLPEAVEVVMDTVHDHTDRIGGVTLTLHTLDDNEEAFVQEYEAAIGGWPQLSDSALPGDG
jgi:hypothetical protein